MSGMTESLVDAMNAALSTTIPIAGKMGVRVVDAGRGYAVTSVPAEGNGNHFGVIALSTFDTGKYFPLVKNLDISYRAMATTDLRAEARVDEETIARIETEAAEHGKSDFTLEATVTDANGTVVATSTGLYQLRAFGK